MPVNAGQLSLTVEEKNGVNRKVVLQKDDENNEKTLKEHGNKCTLRIRKRQRTHNEGGG